jgi:Flp pilus assembly pilin Flp
MEVPMASRTRWFQTIHARLLRTFTRVQLAPLQRREEGVTSVEYILIVAVVAVVVFAALKGFFGAVAGKFNELTDTVSGG